MDRKVSPQQVQAILELSRQRMTIAQISERLGIPGPTVNRYRRANGFRTRGGDITETRRRRVGELTRQGLSLNTIADILKVTQRTVARDRKAIGIAAPPPRHYTDEELDTVERLLDDGASLSEAARTIGRSEHGLHKHPRFKGRAWTSQQCVEFAVFCAKMSRCG